MKSGKNSVAVLSTARASTKSKRHMDGIFSPKQVSVFSKSKSQSKDLTSLNKQKSFLSNLASSKKNTNLHESLGKSSVLELKDTLRNRAVQVFKDQDPKFKEDKKRPGRLNRKDIWNLANENAKKRYRLDKQ